MILGIDPGGTGAMSYMQKGKLEVVRFKDTTEHEIAARLLYLKKHYPKVVAVLEQVHSMPKQGVVSTFKFGRSFGFIQGCLTTAAIPFTMVSPQRWQKDIGVMRKGKSETQTAFKLRMKGMAQRMYPDVKITADMADAILIMRYGRLTNRVQAITLDRTDN